MEKTVRLAMQGISAFTLVFIAGGALSGCQKLERSYCEMRLPAAAIDVQTDPVHFNVTHFKDARSIGDTKSADGEFITYGLTSASTSVKAEVTMHVMRLPGAVCVRPEIRVKLAYEPMKIDLASELHPDGCPYRAVMEHEMKHVDVYRKQLLLAGSTLQSELKSDTAAGVARYRSLDEASAAVQHLQDDVVVPKAQALLDAAIASQHQVDTPAEYQRVTAACPGDAWLQSAPLQNN